MAATEAIVTRSAANGKAAIHAEATAGAISKGTEGDSENVSKWVEI